MIKRLTAAVVVNHKKVTAADGKVTYVALPAPELENVNALVREAIGFAKDRGDSINVVNAPFSREDAAKEVPVPLWKQPDVIDMGKEGARYLGLLMLALIVIFTVIRPSLKALTAAPVAPPPRLNETVRDDLSLPAPGGGTAQTGPALPNPNDAILKLARDNPAAVANVVRGWVGNGA